jgi:enoyl-CoA hydratase
MTITEDRQGPITILTIRRPKQLNALNRDVIAGLQAALDRLETSDATAFVLTGEGRAFSAGGDLKAAQDPDFDMEANIANAQALVLRIAEFPKISVAAINGLAFGGGLELSMACTLRVAAPSAVLCLPEVRMSQIPSYGATQLLPRLVGMGIARELLLVGEPIDVNRALSIGLINKVADDVVAASVDMAERASTHSSLQTQQIMRRALTEGLALPLSDALKLERELGYPLRNSLGGMKAVQDRLTRKA